MKNPKLQSDIQLAALELHRQLCSAAKFCFTPIRKVLLWFTDTRIFR